MRKYLILLLVVFCVRVTYAQDVFTVIKVSGNIIIERTGSQLGIGTSFTQNENLVFKAPDSRAAVINPQRGRFLLTSQNSAEFRSSKSNYLPSAAKISTRAVGFGTRTSDLKNNLEGNYVILDENKIIVDTIVYPLASKKYFFLKYDYNNKPVNKKLASVKDTLIIKRNEVLTVGGTVIPNPQITMMQLIYFREGEINGATVIGTFTPVFPDPVVFKKEIQIIVDQMKMNPYTDKFREISAFIRDFYGKVDENSLKGWLNDNLNLKP
jgi:hypothetical protein